MKKIALMWVTLLAMPPAFAQVEINTNNTRMTDPSETTIQNSGSATPGGATPGSATPGVAGSTTATVTATELVVGGVIAAGVVSAANTSTTTHH